MTKKISRTMRVRESTLKTYYYLRAISKIESKESESFIFEKIITEGIEALEQLEKENKRVFLSNYKGKRYVIGGKLSPEINEKFQEIAQRYNWENQECLEVLIYFSSKNRLSEEELQFFGTPDIAIVNM